MEINQNIAEYYDELYPVTEEQKVFYSKKMEMFKKPVRFLRIGCGTGSFEHNLAKDGSDVTGLETSPELLESANRKRRTQLMAVRYFQMQVIEMSRFLGKKFYNIISILDNRLLFSHDKTLMAKFFYDCKQLLSENGILIVKIPNFELYNSSKFDLPVRESIRASLFTSIEQKGDEWIMNQHLINSSNKKIKVTEDAPVYLIKKQELEELARAAGFTDIKFYSGFNLESLKSDSQEILAVLS